MEKKTLQIKNVSPELKKRVKLWCKLNGNAHYVHLLETDKRLKNLVLS